MRPPVMLVILDGWGWREAREDNAVLLANTPNFNRLWEASPHALLHTSGLDVGLPAGQMGNSEVGHLNLGAGRVVMQDLPRINLACADGALATLPALVGLIGKLKASGGTCHLLGLASDGVHSNGYSFVRKVVAMSGLAWDAPCPFSAGTLGAALLTPTRLYVRQA